MLHRDTLLSIWGVVCAAIGVVGSASAADPSVALKSQLESRFKAVQNVVANFVLSSSFDVPPDIAEILKGNPKLILPNQSDYTASFAFLDGKARFEKRLSPDAPRDPRRAAIDQLTIVYPGNRTEMLAGQTTLRKPGGAIDFPTDPPVDIPIDVALGLRGWGQRRWLSVEDVQRMTVDVDDSGAATATLVASDGSEHKWVFDARLAIRSYEWRQKSAVRVGFRVTNTEFQDYRGVLLPHRISAQRFDGNTDDQAATMTFDIRVKDYELHSARNIDGLYAIEWPRGIHVLDRRTRDLYRVDERGLLVPEIQRTNDLLDRGVEEIMDTSAEVTNQNLQPQANLPEARPHIEAVNPGVLPVSGVIMVTAGAIAVAVAIGIGWRVLKKRA